MVDDLEPRQDDSQDKGTRLGGELSDLAQIAQSNFYPHHAGIGTRLRNYFLTGLIIAGPVGITLYIMWWFINLVDGWVKPFLPETYLPFSVPGVGLIFAVTALIVIGALTANLFGRSLVNYGERIVSRMPVVRSVYRALKQIFETVLSQSSASFQKAGLIEYPRKGLYAIVFIATETSGEILTKTEEENGLLSVFLPTTPNPTSGFLLFVPRADIVILEMNVAEAAKMVISAGLVVPKHQEQLAELAKKAKMRGPEREREPV